MQNLLSSFIPAASNLALEGAFLSSLAQPAALQSMVLQDILKRASGTEFGRLHGFAGINSPEEYSQRVPLSAWAGHAAYCQRLADGEKNLLFPGPTLHFLQTSGTTGQNKWVPQGARGIEINHVLTRIRSHFRQAAVAEIASSSSYDTKVLLLSGPRQLATTAGGIPVWYASGVTAASAPTELRKLHAIPPWVYGVKDTTVRDYLILRFALAEPNLVAAIGNNPRRFSALLGQVPALAPTLISCIQSGELGCSASEEIPAITLPPNPTRAAFLAKLQQQGRLQPQYYWPHFNMACFWLGGPMAPAIQQLSMQFSSDTLFFDAGYGASELKINVPMAPGSPYAPLALFAGFFEFLPEHGGPPLPCWQLQDGHIYEIVLTTYSGLYRHRLGDLIRVHGFVHNTPNIAFYSRVEETANLAGERTAAPLLLAAAETTCRTLGGRLSAFSLWPDATEGRYHCFYEACEEFLGNDQDHWAKVFDESLRHLSAGYARRRLDGSLEPPTATQMPHGWEASLHKTRDADGQAKGLTILFSSPKLS